MNGTPSGTFVKICGITRAEEAQVAVRAGANAVGFVFAAGPRRISPTQAAKIGAHVHPSVHKIGVFVDASFKDIEAHMVEAGLDGVQLHGAEVPGLVQQLKESFPSLTVFKAIKMNGRQSAEAALQFAGHADAVLLDRKDVTNPGRRVDPFPLEWLEGVQIENMILAGGLTPENVSEAIKTVKPWGVDASGGLEIRPGAKDPEKVSAFVRAVRRAETGRS